MQLPALYGEKLECFEALRSKQKNLCNIQRNNEEYIRKKSEGI